MPRIKPIFASLTITLLSITAAASIFQPASLPPTTQNADSEPVRNIAEWDLSKKSLAINGYDPVAYFPEAGSKPTKGSKKITLEYKGAVYRFANETNKATFITNPAKYEPAYGGWCAWAMAKGSKTEINPKTFIIKDDRLFLFYNALFGNTKEDWKKGSHATLASSADAEWLKISGESPRLTN